MDNIFSGKICSYYKNIVEHIGESNKLLTPGRNFPILEILTNERYTNTKQLNKARNSVHDIEEYRKLKKGLSAASFSSVQDDLTIDRSDKNHLFHTGLIAFDIDVDKNEWLKYPGEGDRMKEFLINENPYIAYLGKSVSNFGFWGLIGYTADIDHPIPAECDQ